VAHTYPAVGVYTAIVTASNPVSVLTATTTVTITDVPIAGLVATNDSPTVLGQATTLMATITDGSNVVYTWAFGDGDPGSGAVVAHTYPTTGTYTAVVTASNSVSVVPATTTVTIIEAPKLYLPIIMKNYTPPSVPPTETPTPTATGTLPPTDTPTPTATPTPIGPDLVVTDISVVPNPPQAGQSAMVYVTVKNQGNRPVAYGNNFYVDFYVDREPAPLLRGDIEWGVQGSWFGVGESRTLSRTLSDSYTFTQGTHQLYAQADTDETVTESNENNNALGPMPLNVTSLGGGEAPVGPAVIPTPGVDSPRPTPTPRGGQPTPDAHAGTINAVSWRLKKPPCAQGGFLACQSIVVSPDCLNHVAVGVQAPACPLRHATHRKQTCVCTPDVMFGQSGGVGRVNAGCLVLMLQFQACILTTS
jgi:hypothetical protein